jgi:hypothetical protein
MLTTGVQLVLTRLMIVAWRRREAPDRSSGGERLACAGYSSPLAVLAGLAVARARRTAATAPHGSSMLTRCIRFEVSVSFNAGPERSSAV